jgi:hypothetical protein
MVEKLSRELSETQAALFEEGQHKGKLQMELDAKEMEIEQLRQKLAVTDNVSINSSHLEDGDISQTSACRSINRSHLMMEESVTTHGGGISQKKGM